MLKRVLSHPITRDIDIDVAETTRLRRIIINQKPFLKQLYNEWYINLLKNVPEVDVGLILELGSGAGFFDIYLPNVIKSDILFLDNLHLVTDAHNLPFKTNSLKAVLMVNVFHHLKSPAKYLEEAARCVKVGGVLSMIEPWVTPWSNFIYQKFHNEPFHPDTIEWEIPVSGPLSGANGALPWIVFKRDRSLFEDQFPAWKLRNIELHTPFRYLLSGGLSMRSLMPGCSFGFWSKIECLLNTEMDKLAMFANITLVRSI